MKLNASSRGNAVHRLREGLIRDLREPLGEQLRDGLIQRCEFTYELSHRMLRRYIRDNRSLAGRDRAPAVCRFDPRGKCSGLLRSGWPEWRRFREMRARTSHTYDAGAAALVVAAIPRFLEEVEYLYRELERRLA